MPKKNKTAMKEKASTKAPKAREKPHCRICRNHNKIELKTRLHQCPYEEKQCPCDLCKQTKARRLTMMHQVRIWRHQKTQMPQKETRKYKCSRCLNHFKTVGKANHHECPHENCTCSKCMLVTTRQKIMKMDQKLKRKGITIKSPIEGDLEDESPSTSAGIQNEDLDLRKESSSTTVGIHNGDLDLRKESSSTTVGIHNGDLDLENEISTSARIQNGDLDLRKESSSTKFGIHNGDLDLENESSTSIRIQNGDLDLRKESSSTTVGIHNRNLDLDNESLTSSGIQNRNVDLAATVPVKRVNGTLPSNSEPLSGLRLEEIAPEEIGLKGITPKELSPASCHLESPDLQPDKVSKIPKKQLQRYAPSPSESRAKGVQRNTAVKKVNAPLSRNNHKLLNTLGSRSSANKQKLGCFPQNNLGDAVKPVEMQTPLIIPMGNMSFTDGAPTNSQSNSMAGLRHPSLHQPYSMVSLQQTCSMVEFAQPISMVVLRPPPQASHSIRPLETLSHSDRPIWHSFPPSVSLDPSKFHFSSITKPLDLSRPRRSQFTNS